MTHWYLHVDLDAFFASVEQLDHPEYKGKPVIVGGKPEDRRSVVSTASYEARKFGVHSAMPTYQAYKLCPQGIFVYGRMDRYSSLSYQIMEIFRNYSPDVDQMSIDEAFIDLTGTENLFGPPEETAMKIKAQVKKETGLTVSIGLATTKYLAKIASGYSKPDGFYFIHPGDEQNFMLSLPLNKVWGLGPKSLELLRSKSILTTRDIYDKPYETLEFLFGKNMATFLFDVVRGNEKESFNQKAKNHSISSETTFLYDLTDVYTIETKLLELAHGVYFRLLKHNSYSKTAFVKLRYEDFSTCTIQETLDRNIMTLDSYFEILKRLFEKKYDKNRGIRLLGVGFENVETEEKPFQQELFSNNDEKKQTLEKAILKLEKKHPEIHVRKARTLKTILLFLLLTVSKPFQTNAQDAEIIQEDASESLFNWNISDTNNVEFNIEGYWKGLFTGVLNTSFGNDYPFSYSLGSPVFTQEVQLSALFLLNNHWYFQADFAEEFKKNTLTLGYKGDGYLRSAKLSNRNITMAEGYSSADFGYGLEGGENQAPGFSSHWQSPFDTWEADFLIRYDMTEVHSATFYGMNHVSQQKINLDNYLYGYCFEFPADTANELSELKDIYVESKQGKYTDSYGRKYKKLSTSDYTIILSQNKIYLSNSANAGKQNDSIPTVVITFLHSATASTIVSKTGNYKDSSSFAGNIQKKFSYDLEKYTSNPLISIENENGLIIQQPAGFSPYLRHDFYDCGNSKNSDFLVIDQNTEKNLTSYLAEAAIEDSTVLHEDFFTEKRTYAKITDLTDKDNKYPFADICPEIYLNLPSKTPIKLLVRSYSPVSELSIGTNASSGSVMVYKNNEIDAGARYDSNTGIVSLSSSVLDTDKIFIMWQEDTVNYENGALTAGAGFKYNFTPNLLGDWSLTASWPLAYKQNYSTPDNLRRGFAAFTTGITYCTENNDFSISNKTAVSVQKDNGAEKLLVKTQDDFTPKTFYLESNAGYATKAEPVLSIGNTKKLLLQADNFSTGNHRGSSDAQISGSRIPLSWNFADKSSGWAAVDIHLSEGKKLLDASRATFSFKPEISSSDTEDYELYLQLGINASLDYHGEDNYNIPTWKIENLNLHNNQWQTATINLTEDVRARLVSASDARIIILTKGNTSGFQGTIYAGPYEIFSNSLLTAQDEEIHIFTSSIKRSGTSTEKDSFSSSINWNISASTTYSQLKSSLITIKNYFSPADFSTYENITFDFCLNGYDSCDIDGESNSPALTLILDQTSADSGANQSPAVKLELDSTKNLFTTSISYHQLKINIKNRKVYIDDQELPLSSYKLYINSNIIPSSQTIIFNTVTDSKMYRNGTLYINNLCYSDSKVYGTAQNKTALSVNKDFEYVKLSGDFLSSQTTGRFDDMQFASENSANVGIKAVGMNVQANVSTKNLDLKDAGHSVSTENSLFNFLSLEESYNFSKMDKSLNKKDSLKLDFSGLTVPVIIGFSTNAQYNRNSKKQNLNSNFTYTYTYDDYKIGFNADLKLNQKNNNQFKTEKLFDCENYFYGWKDISTLQFSKGDEKAVIRSEEIKGKIDGAIPWKNFSPSFEYILSGNYNNSSETKFKDSTTLNLTLPFTLNNTYLSFIFERNGNGISEIAGGGDYFSDGNKLFEIQNNRSWIYSQAPFYELFDTNLTDKIDANYSTKYETKFSRKLFNDFSDLYIPSAVNLSVIRSIQKNHKTGDLYQFKAELSNTSLNNFGSDSIDQIFPWFKSEEILTNITGIVKLPADLPENVNWSLETYLQVLLYISDNSSLTSAFNFSIETDFNWNTQFSLLYSRPGNTSFLSSLVNFFIPDDKEINFDIIRKDNFSMDINSTDKRLRQKYTYSHFIDYKFLKFFTVTTGLGGNYVYMQNAASILGLEASIGGKAEF